MLLLPSAENLQLSDANLANVSASTHSLIVSVGQARAGPGREAVGAVRRGGVRVWWGVL